MQISLQERNNNASLLHLLILYFHWGDLWNKWAAGNYYLIHIVHSPSASQSSMRSVAVPW